MEIGIKRQLLVDRLDLSCGIIEPPGSKSLFNCPALVISSLFFGVHHGYKHLWGLIPRLAATQRKPCPDGPGPAVQHSR